MLGSFPLFSDFKLGKFAGGGMRRAAATFPRLCKPCLGITGARETQAGERGLHPARSVTATSTPWLGAVPTEATPLLCQRTGHFPQERSEAAVGCCSSWLTGSLPQQEGRRKNSSSQKMLTGSFSIPAISPLSLPEGKQQQQQQQPFTARGHGHLTSCLCRQPGYPRQQP